MTKASRTENITNTNKSSSGLAEPKRSRQTVLALDDFAHQKGVVHALHGFRERREKKRLHTAKALRVYKKVMKREGYEPGTGASRKRMTETAVELNEGGGDKDDSRENNTAPVDTATMANDSTNIARKKRSNLFQKSIQKAHERKQAHVQSVQDRQVSERERQQRIKERRYRTKLLSQRTSKGQPVMKNIVQDILRKLEREKHE
jgi:hypothetical protein